MEQDRFPFVFAASPTRDFRDANPAVLAQAQGSPEALRALGRLEDRVGSLKDRLREHLSRSEPNWVAREAAALSAKQTAPTLTYPPPRGILPGSPAERIMAQARRNVRARATRRLTALNTAKLRMQDAVVKNAQRPDVAAPPILRTEIQRTLRMKGP